MNRIRISYIIGLLLGVLMLSLVFSQTFTYSVSRTFTVEVVKDPNADIAIIPGIYLSTEKGYVVDGLNGSGDFEFNFTAAPATITNFTPAFYLQNNLNQTVSVEISLTTQPDVIVSVSATDVNGNYYVYVIPNVPAGNTASFNIDIPAGSEAAIGVSIHVLPGVTVPSSYPLKLTINATYPSDS
ncbi:hypothetical protein L3N51_02452 [Metallosphaera sp. J1]|uniref:hypothetical protein n=1 Tax=Metallosphaera javensis (ex Hofmann et al. 2022) TaxID=99938 RepID=UPI001EE13223|nr:hypothetical protein [Metallosphaera javensis (ex Hofmann et al. 2022)]MCG3110155.1 hypothetical protein [Metallosphaera javensis (ex Hofmann et al. 2022)]